MTVVIRAARADDVERAAAVLGDAFRDYAWTRWTVDADDHLRRVAALQRLALEHHGLPAGTVMVAELDGVIHSVAVWMDSAVDVPAQRDEALQRAAVALRGDRQVAARRADQETPQWRPTHRYQYLATIGTSTHLHGRGLGSLVLEPTLRRLDALQLDAFLETSSTSNVEFYARRGFTVIGHHRIAGGGPHIWAMLRRPVGPGRT